jgi:hypothetical protein
VGQYVHTLELKHHRDRDAGELNAGEAEILESSVGVSGTNQKMDVKTVQRLVNTLITKFPDPPKRLSEDGAYGNITRKGIEWMQSCLIGAAASNGQVEPGDTCMTVLMDRFPASMTADTVGLIFLNASTGRVDRYWSHLEPAMMRY